MLQHCPADWPLDSGDVHEGELTGYQFGLTPENLGGLDPAGTPPFFPFSPSPSLPLLPTAPPCIRLPPCDFPTSLVCVVPWSGQPVREVRATLAHPTLPAAHWARPQACAARAASRRRSRRGRGAGAVLSAWDLAERAFVLQAPQHCLGSPPCQPSHSSCGPLPCRHPTCPSFCPTSSPALHVVSGAPPFCPLGSSLRCLPCFSLFPLSRCPGAFQPSLSVARLLFTLPGQLPGLSCSAPGPFPVVLWCAPWGPQLPSVKSLRSWSWCAPMLSVCRALWSLWG